MAGPVGYSRCWICKQWTRNDLLDADMEIAGSKGRVCISCTEALRERDVNLEQKRRMKNARDKPSSDNPAPGQGLGVSDGTHSEATRAVPVSVGEGQNEGAGPVVEPSAVCSEEGCGKIAHWVYQWPNVGTMFACDEHQLRAGSVSTAMGFKVVFKPLRGG